MATYEAHDPSGRQLATLEVRRTADGMFFSEVQWVGDHDAGALVTALRDEANGLTAATLAVAPDQDELLGALGSARHLSTVMSRRIGSDGGGARYRPMTYDEYEQWRYTNVAGYAEATLPRYGGDQQAATRAAEDSFAELLPNGIDSADTSLVVLLDDDDQRVGTLWLRHHDQRPDVGTATFVYDVAVDADRRGQGWARRALVAVDELASRAGDDKVGLNVFTENEIATRLYTTGGFEPVLLIYDLLH